MPYGTSDPEIVKRRRAAHTQRQAQRRAEERARRPERFCPTCGDSLAQKNARAIYCSRRCARRSPEGKAAHSRSETARVKAINALRNSGRTCEQCGQKYDASRNDQKFCSRECTRRHHYLANREEYERRAREWRLAHPQTVAEMVARRRSAIAADPLLLERNRAARRRAENRRRARKVAGAIVDFTEAQLAARIAYFGGLCWMCGVSEWEHLDHVKPISKGGPHMLANIRPACAACNLRKRDAWPLEGLWL